MNRIVLVLSIPVAFLLTSCFASDPQLYSWYDYEDASYQYTKQQTPQSEKALVASYEKIMNKQKGTRKIVPPGIYAEKGYYLIKSGKKEEGLALLKMEIELYPESKLFIDRIINAAQK
jgi:hypothetical protein